MAGRQPQPTEKRTGLHNPDRNDQAKGQGGGYTARAAPRGAAIIDITAIIAVILTKFSISLSVLNRNR